MAMFMRRILEVVKDIKKAMQKQAESAHAAEERERENEPEGHTIHRIVAFDDKTVRDTKEENDRQHGTQISIRNWTAAAVVAASIYAAIAACQLYLTYSANMIDQRAWVGANKFSSSIITGSGEPYIKADTELRFIAQFSNFGKTPARETRTDIVFKFLPKGEVLKPTFEQTSPPITPSVVVVQPGAVHFMQSLPTTFSEPQIEAAKQAKLILYVYGRIRYQDIFGKQHLTNFCSFITPDLKSWDGCPWDNDAD